MRRRVGEWFDALADRLGITPWAIAVGFAAVVAAGLGAWWAFAPPAPPPAEEVLPSVGDIAVVVPTTASAAPTTMLVHVDGAVMRPGVHELDLDSRVVDAVDAAGGLRADADRARLNLAAMLSDGQRVWVPVIGESEPDVVGPTGGGPAGTADGAGPAGGVVNLNTADAAELETLPGVGPSIAAAIIRHRETEGAFQRVEDLLEVAGIGPSRLAQIEGLVAV
ncbi:MAG: ComEA family DNA-binding protein [Acidimicrobiales bacterium]|nr:ComEA family DNA-binding protein [Acidimicrobiales bacterium]